MSGLAPRKKNKGGSVTVYNSGLYSELVVRSDSEKNEEVEIGQSLFVSPVVSPRHHYGSSPTRLPSRSSTAQMIRMEDWLSRKARRAVVSFPDDPKVAAVKQFCDTISKNEKEFLAELDSFISSHEERLKCKKEILYKKWCDRVFVPIQTKLAEKMASSEFQVKDFEKRSLFDQYLCHGNKKDVFLDIFNPKEYHPTPAGGASLQVCTDVLDDPLIASRTEHEKERLVLSGFEEGIPLQHSEPISGDGRTDTDPVLWLSMKLLHIDSEARQKSKNRMHHDHNAESGKQENSEMDLNIPHKRTVHYPREKFELVWSGSS